MKRVAPKAHWLPLSVNVPLKSMKFYRRDNEKRWRLVFHLNRSARTYKAETVRRRGVGKQNKKWRFPDRHHALSDGQKTLLVKIQIRAKPLGWRRHWQGINKFKLSLYRRVSWTRNGCSMYFLCNNSHQDISQCQGCLRRAHQCTHHCEPSPSLAGAVRVVFNWIQLVDTFHLD
jgi:hypothetical protein